MLWTRISAYATSLPNTLTFFTPKWRDHVLSQWYWLPVLIVIVAVTALLHRRYRQGIPVDTLWEETLPPMKISADSPFFAYLGHNALTESSPNDPNNTSIDAIERIMGHVQPENVMLTEISEEPQEYSPDTHDVLPWVYQYRSYTYPDTQNKQIRIDHVEQMRDNAQDRRWQRRTVHVCAI